MNILKNSHVAVTLFAVFALVVGCDDASTESTEVDQPEEGPGTSGAESSESEGEKKHLLERKGERRNPSKRVEREKAPRIRKKAAKKGLVREEMTLSRANLSERKAPPGTRTSIGFSSKTAPYAMRKNLSTGLPCPCILRQHPGHVVFEPRCDHVGDDPGAHRGWVHAAGLPTGNERKRPGNCGSLGRGVWPGGRSADADDVMPPRLRCLHRPRMPLCFLWMQGISKFPSKTTTICAFHSRSIWMSRWISFDRFCSR